MICFEVSINGIKKYTIGSVEADEFGINLIAAPQLKPTHISAELSGFIANDKKYPHELRWGSENIKLGDEILIKIINSKSPDEPQEIRYDEGLSDTGEQFQTMLCTCCGKSHFETNQMIRSSKVSLCEECVKSFAEILENKEIET